MASRRSDLLHSYQFMVQRVVSALVMRDTDPAQSPFRRAAGATLASVLVALIIAAGFGIYGVFTNRGDVDWQTDGAVVIEKETGARYVYMSGKLHPAMNLASAMLAHADGTETHLFTVSRKSLEGVQRGLPIGVPELPDSLPPSEQLVGLPWTVCSGSGDQPKSALVIGDDKLAASGRPMSAEEGIFVRVAQPGQADLTFLLWNGYRYEVAARVRDSVDLDAALAGSPAFINSITAGQPLDVPAIKDIGQPSEAHSNLVNGQAAKLLGNPDRFAVVTDGGLASVTKLQYDLLIGAFRHSQELPKPIDIAPEDVGSYAKAGTFVPDPTDPLQPPAALPTVPRVGAGAICAVVKDVSGAVEVRTEIPLKFEDGIPTVRRTGAGKPYADYVFVTPGKGAVVSTGQTFSLITDRGIRFPAANPAVLAQLGYAKVTSLVLPSSLIDLLPQGPALDPEVARTQLLAGDSVPTALPNQ